MDAEQHTSIWATWYAKVSPYLGDIGFEGFLVLLFVAAPALLVFVYRQWSYRRALLSGALGDEVVMHFMNFEQDARTGEWFLKPRVGIAAQPIAWVFPNPALVSAIVAATKRCTTTPSGSFIRLHLPYLQKLLMKHVRGVVSATNPSGQAARAAGRPCDTEIFYVYTTYSSDGDAQRRIRIDAVHEEDLKRFVAEGMSSDDIHTRADEGSHDDHKAILRLCAKAMVANDETTVIRTSISFERPQST